MQPLRLMRGGAQPQLTNDDEKWERISELFTQARENRLPTPGKQPNEPNTLNELHLQMIMMRAQGMRQREIARVMNYTDSRVSIVLNSPDARYLLDQLHGLMGVGVTAIENRLQLLNERAVESIEEAFDSDDVKPLERAKLGFALLERNGFGVRREVEVQHNHTLQLNPRQESVLASALRESRTIEEVEYVEIPYTPGPQPSIALGASQPASEPPSGGEAQDLGGTS